MSFKEPIDRLRERVEQLISGMQETTKSIRELVRSSRPKPLKSLLSERVNEIRPLQRLMKRSSEKE